MSHHSGTSVGSTGSSKAKSRRDRCLSPCQVAKDPSQFETWSAYQNCEEVDYANDLPDVLRPHAVEVFRLVGQLPLKCMDKKSKCYRNLVRNASPEFIDFLASAHASASELFSEDVAYDDEMRAVLDNLRTIFTAWKSAEAMRKSTRKFSETEYAMKVYTLVRTSAVERSVARLQHSICLPQPAPTHKLTPEAIRTLNAKIAKPDGLLFIPTVRLAELCEMEQSPYKVLSRSLRRKSGTVGGESSFRYQSTLCAKLPDARVFEIAGVFWEDKKPSQDELHTAYRQNRMATTAALRQLHALNVRAPVFGVVWAEGKVRAHVDWWQVKGETGEVMIYSAAYSGPPTKKERRLSGAFHEWDLAKPEDIIRVFLLMRNLDRWMTGAFCDAVVAGVTDLASKVQLGYTIPPWRRSGDLARLVGRKIAAQQETHDEDGTPAAEPVAETTAPAKRKSKKRKPRTSS
ncbi:hypothetical protein C8Q73DRAFT_683286 [Cubamyces lactineus]|nr:hypothetical protein C8Q73DRAFT_683286 [Cubamyces lactineus]